jgi:hypothetical protein
MKALKIVMGLLALLAWFPASHQQQMRASVSDRDSILIGLLPGLSSIISPRGAALAVSAVGLLAPWSLVMLGCSPWIGVRSSSACAQVPPFQTILLRKKRNSVLSA